jgi:hypothetical protein
MKTRHLYLGILTFLLAATPGNSVLSAQIRDLRVPPLEDGIEIKDAENSQQDLSRLPDSQVIRLAGRKTTMGAIRADMQAVNQRTERWLRLSRTRADLNFKKYQTEFAKAQEARSENEIARARAEMRAMKQPSQTGAGAWQQHQARLAELRNEARDLQRNFQSATRANKVAILRRANEILQELRSMGLAG